MRKHCSCPWDLWCQFSRSKFRDGPHACLRWGMKRYGRLNWSQRFVGKFFGRPKFLNGSKMIQDDSWDFISPLDLSTMSIVYPPNLMVQWSIHLFPDGLQWGVPLYTPLHIHFLGFQTHVETASGPAYFSWSVGLRVSRAEDLPTSIWLEKHPFRPCLYWKQHWQVPMVPSWCTFQSYAGMLLNNIEQYWTLLNNIEQYWTILNNIEQYWTILNNIEQRQTLKSHVQKASELSMASCTKKSCPMSLLRPWDVGVGTPRQWLRRHVGGITVVYPISVCPV